MARKVAPLAQRMPNVVRAAGALHGPYGTLAPGLTASARPSGRAAAAPLSPQYGLAASPLHKGRPQAAHWVGAGEVADAWWRKERPAVCQGTESTGSTRVPRSSCQVPRYLPGVRALRSPPSRAETIPVSPPAAAPG